MSFLGSLQRSIRFTPSRVSDQLSSEPQSSTTTPSITRRGSISSNAETITTRSCIPTTHLTTPERIDTALSIDKIPESFDVADTRNSGVDWQLADVGVRLWLNARSQTDLARNSNFPHHLRAMHIDAIRYMTMALPKDLTQAEINLLQSSSPPQLCQHLHSNHNTLPCSPNQQPHKPNLFRQTISQTVYCLIALLFILLPLLTTFLNKILIYERQHKIMERVFVSGTYISRSLAGRGMDIGDALVRFRDTPAGRYCLESVVWFITGVAGGINDGISRIREEKDYGFVVGIDQRGF